MAKQKFSDDEVNQALMEVFRTVGYEGASLEELAKAVGLRKSSLYHRYPNGKKQMAEEVLKFSHRWVTENIVDLLLADGDPKKRLKGTIRSFSELYDGGHKTCILRALSMERGLVLFSELINQTFTEIIAGFVKLAKDLGFEENQAKELAREALISIQGSLVLAKGTNNYELFETSLKKIEKSFLGSE